MSIPRNAWIPLVLLLVVNAGCRKDQSAEPPVVTTIEPAEIQPAPATGEAETPVTDSAGAANPVAPAPVEEGGVQAVHEPPDQDTAPDAQNPAEVDVPVAEAAVEASPGTTAASPATIRSRMQAPPNTPALPDLRLLLTTTDIDVLTAGKATLRRTVLAGVPPTAHNDAMMYEPQKGTGYGVGIQLFREENAALTRDRFNAMLASYPSAQEIAAVAGRTLFAYWDDVLYLGFIQPTKNLVIVISCGRTYCTSDAIYDLARKVSTRSSS